MDTVMSKEMNSEASGEGRDKRREREQRKTRGRGAEEAASADALFSQSAESVINNPDLQGTIKPDFPTQRHGTYQKPIIVHTQLIQVRLFHSGVQCLEMSLNSLY